MDETFHQNDPAGSRTRDLPFVSLALYQLLVIYYPYTIVFKLHYHQKSVSETFQEPGVIKIKGKGLWR